MNQVGRFQILEELGRGAYGVVYRALDPAIGRTVAIKTIRFSEVSDPAERRDLRERVLREAQSAGKLSHPNIVTIYDVVEGDDLAHIFMEFVDGPSLKDAMRRPVPLSREQVLGLLRQVAEALDYAHRKGIIHRDIKPANIILSDRSTDEEGVAKIADFGIAKLLSHEATHQRTFTGTPSYMSPEQSDGAPVGGASDQFSLAVMVYELLTGEKPFVAENLSALRYRLSKHPAKPVHERNPALSETVNRVMERALAKSPAERHPSCSEFMGALSVALGECSHWQPVRSRRSEESERPGNGWHAPCTVASSRLEEEEDDDDDTVTSDTEVPLHANQRTATAVKPAPNHAQTRRQQEDEPVSRPAAAGIATAAAMDSYTGQAFAPDVALVSGVHSAARISVESPALIRFSTVLAGCIVLAVLSFLAWEYFPSIHTSSQDAAAPNRVLPVPTQEDLSASNRQPTASQPPLDLTTAAPPSTLVVKDESSTSTTTVAVPTPAVKKAEAPPPVQAAAPPPHAEEKIPAQSTPVEHTVTPAPIFSEVELVSDPPGARVEVDGQPGRACIAPCSVPLAPGRHTLVAGLGDGYRDTRKIFNVPMTGSVFVPMLRNMGMLLLTSEPAGTTVSIDGKSLGRTPVKINLPAGKHQLSLSDGQRHHEETIQIETDGLYARSFRW